MAVSKKFYEEASKDPALRAELEQATLEALAAFLKEKGLEQEAAMATEAAAAKVAEAHGFAPDGAPGALGQCLQLLPNPSRPSE